MHRQYSQEGVVFIHTKQLSLFIGGLVVVGRCLTEQLNNYILTLLNIKYDLIFGEKY